jgi:hypothetical protein
VLAAMGLSHTQQTLVSSFACAAMHCEPNMLCMCARGLERIKEVLVAMGLSHTQQTLVGMQFHMYFDQ